LMNSRRVEEGRFDSLMRKILSTRIIPVNPGWRE
jgi:hypothetical protein